MSGPKVVTREEAKELNLTRYFTGKPCVNGHIAERYVLRGSCCFCERARNRLLRGNNLEKYRKYSREYHYRNREKCRKQTQEWLNRNRDRCLERDRKWKEKNREKVKEAWDRWYKFGSSEITGETQWLIRNRAVLRSVKRALRSSNPCEALQLLSKELQQVNSSPR